MNSIPFSRLAAITVLAAAGLPAQSVLVSVRSASPKVMVHGTAQVTAAMTAINGTPLDTGSLIWASSDSSIATVSSAGLVTGLAPGDARIGVTDPNTGVAAWTLLHIVPSAMSLKTSAGVVTVGETAQLSASALDAAGKIIPGLSFQFRSGQNSVASVSADGVITGVAEGFVTVEAGIAGVASNPALIATTQIRVLAKPRYKIRKILSTATASSTTIAAVTSISAVSPTVAGAIVTLANGGQAAILLEGGKTKVLAVAGQQLAATGRLVVRIGAISTNSKGDTALLIEYPSQWCSASVFLFPHNQPEIELGAANCNNGITPHSLGEDGSVLFRWSDQIWSASASSAPALRFSVATQPVTKDALLTVNQFVAGGGAYLISGALTSGVTGYFWSDGSNFTQVYRTGDTIRNAPSSNMDWPIGSASGLFYARVNASGYSALVQLGASGLKTLLVTGDDVATGKLGWVSSLSDAGTSGILFSADFNVPNNYHSGIALWKNGITTEAAPMPGWAGIIAGAIPTDGVPLVYAVLKSDAKVPGLRALPSSGDARLVLESGSNFPQPAPAGIDWHFASRGGGSALLPLHAAGEAIVTVDSAVRTLAIVGAPLPNGKIAVSIGAAMSNGSGDLVFTAGYCNGSALFRYRGGSLETVQDTAVPGLTAISSVSWFSTYSHGRYLAMNKAGDVAHISQFYSGAIPLVVFVSGGVTKLVAALNIASPSGASYSSFNNVAVDDRGRVLFTATTVDGRAAVYFWDGDTVQRVIGTGDKTASGTVNEVSNIAGGGQGFVIMLALDNYRARELRAFDGQMRIIESTDTSLLDGTWMNYFWMNESTIAANGDVHYQVQTQDGGVGVYARRNDGSLSAVARSSSALPAGEWLVFPLTVSSAASGEVYFTAYTWSNGAESLGLYLATPQ